MRQLGKALLRRRPADAGGRAARPAPAGAAGELRGTREWQFGDTEPWDVTRTSPTPSSAA
jgi:uncharacterized protein with von Willebrand factor type A (vWA) domain